MPKDTFICTKRQPIEWEKIFTNYTCNRELISKIYKELKGPHKKNQQKLTNSRSVHTFFMDIDHHGLYHQWLLPNVFSPTFQSPFKGNGCLMFLLWGKMELIVVVVVFWCAKALMKYTAPSVEQSTANLPCSRSSSGLL